MTIGELIQCERKRKNMTQQELSKKIHVARSTISKIEKGYSVSHQLLIKIIEVLDSPRLRLEVLGGALPCYYLDRVDMSPLATKGKALEEMREAIQELEMLDLINKTSSEDLSADEKEELLVKTMVEIQDVNNCADLLLTSLAETYDISLQQLDELYRQKLEDRGYRSKFEVEDFIAI